MCKHASRVPFSKKSKHMRRLWRYTSETKKRIERLETASEAAFQAVLQDFRVPIGLKSASNRPRSPRHRRLNEELLLPERYVAVQLRRGDKVAGNRKESVLLTGQDFATEALKHIDSECRVIVVCREA